MAASRDTSNGPGWRDVASALQSFEAMNKVHLEIRMGVAEYRNAPDLTMEILAHQDKEKIGVAACLASANASAGSQGFRTIEALTLFLLYQIDFVLARDEFAKTLNP